MLIKFDNLMRLMHVNVFGCLETIKSTRLQFKVLFCAWHMCYASCNIMHRCAQDSTKWNRCNLANRTNSRQFHNFFCFVVGDSVHTPKWIVRFPVCPYSCACVTYWMNEFDSVCDNDLLTPSVANWLKRKQGEKIENKNKNGRKKYELKSNEWSLDNWVTLCDNCLSQWRDRE